MTSGQDLAARRALPGPELRSRGRWDSTTRHRLHAMVQHEPLSAFTQEEMGLLRALGIVKGAEFQPDDRMRRILANGVRLVDVFFGPRAPKGREKNWVQKLPGKGWFPYLRLYGPLEPFFDETWRPDDIVKA